MRRVRIFVSSPSDVDFERQRVDRVAERLNGVFAHAVRFEPIRWEKKFYSADQTFQHQIPDAAECDLVIAIFWSRLGSPLPEHFGRMPNGERYPSGSAYEVLTAIEARRSGDKPDVYVFRKAAPPLHRIDQDEALDDAKAQWKALNEFFARWFHTPEGEFLAAFHQFHTTDEFEEQIERLLRHWIDDHIPHSRSVIWPIETMGSPFRALLPFDAKHASVYFGRDRKVTRAIEQLKNVAQGLRNTSVGPRSIPFLLIVGESGAGKSSLMRAGVAPRLTAPGAVPKVDLWRTAIMRVGDDANPFLTLATALSVSGKGDDEGGFGAALPELRNGEAASPDALAELLASGTGTAGKRVGSAARAIVKALAQVAAEEKRRGGFQRRLRANLLLLVDQLENIFAADLAEAQRSAFARLLFSLAATRRIWIVATLRSDLYPRMITPGDFIALKDAGGDYDLAAPGEAELSEIVHMSAAATGLVYETNAQSGERLDERILKDAQGENTLPLLEFALERLFNEREVVEGETRLTFAAYEAMGRLGGAIDQAAEAALAALGEKEIAALPRLLRSLAVPVREKKTATVGGGELTVRTVPIADAIPDAAARALVDALIEARIIVATATERETDHIGQIGVAHQRVFESWKRARQIVEDHKDFFRIRDEVEAGRQRWQANGRPSALLLPRGVPLAEAEKIVNRYGDELAEDMRGYVAQSGRRARRNQRIMRAVAAVFAILFVTATATGIFAYRNGQRAEENYGAAKATVDHLVSVIAEGLGKLEGIRVATIDSVLGVVDETIKKLQTASRGDPQLDRTRAAMLYQFAKTYQQTGSHAKAVARAEESLAIRARLTNYDRLKAAPTEFELVPDDLRWELSQSLELMGDLYRVETRVRDARTCFEDTLSIRLRLAAKSPKNDDWAQGLSFLYVRIGDLDMDVDLAAAQMNYEKSLAIAAEFFRRNTEVIRWQRELSWPFQKIGVVRMRRGDLEKKSGNLAAANGEFSAALDAFASNLCLRRRMAERTPNNTEFKRDVSYALDRIGPAKRELGDRAGAEDSYFEALAIRRALARNDPDDARYQGDVATSLQQIGDYYAGVPDPDLALAFYEAALDIRLQLQLRVKEDKRAQQDVDAARKKVESSRHELGERGRLEGYSTEWWRVRVRETEDALARRRDRLALDTNACWGVVIATAEKIVGPTYTAATK